MALRLSCVYLRLLFGFVLLLVSLSLALHVSFLSGQRLSTQFAKEVFLSAFAINFPIAFLAKERNVWRNEFKACPKWLRILIVAMTAYGLLIPLASISRGVDPLDPAHSGSALPLFFEAMPLGILYSLLYPNAIDKSELIRRVRNSTIALLLTIGLAVAIRMHLVPNKIS